MQKLSIEDTMCFNTANNSLENTNEYIPHQLRTLSKPKESLSMAHLKESIDLLRSSASTPTLSQQGEVGWQRAATLSKGYRQSVSNNMLGFSRESNKLKEELKTATIKREENIRCSFIQP